MTAQAPYESLTTVDAVTDAHDDGRIVECLPPGRTDWMRTFACGTTVAADLAAGWQYRAALPERAPVSVGGVDDLIALLGEIQTERTVLLHFSDSAQARIRDGLSALTGYLSGLETLVHRITGDEGEDDALDVLQRYAEQLEATPAPPVGADWVIWRGGECPVAKDVRVDYLMRNALEGCECSDLAGDLNWNHGDPTLGSASEIIAFRARSAAPTPAEARGVGDGVTDEMVAAARQAYWDAVGVTTGYAGMRRALQAALATRQAQAQGSEAAHARAGEGSNG